jgi:predicted nucleic acid-binding protein
MPTYLLDTNAVSDLMAEHPRVTARVARESAVVTSVIVRGEIRYGLERLPPGNRRQRLEEKARQILEALEYRPITEEVGDDYGRIRRQMELAGLSLDDNDLWIAATAKCFDCVLVSRDTDFSGIHDLEIEDWTR